MSSKAHVLRRLAALLLFSCSIFALAQEPLVTVIPPESSPISAPSGLVSSAVFEADLDSDGFTDLVVLYQNLDTISATPSLVYVYWGREDQTFAADTSPLILKTSRTYTQAAIEDLDHDGKLEVVLSGGNWIDVLRLTQTSISEAEHFLLDSENSATTSLNSTTTKLTPSASGTAAQPTAATTQLKGTLTSDPAAPGYGRSFTLTATFIFPAGTPPAGNVSFAVDGALAGTGTLANGIATSIVNLPTYAVGNHSLTAAFPGDVNYAASTLTSPLAVTLLPTTTYMTDVVTPIHYGEIIGDIAKGFVNPSNPMAGDTQLLDGGNLTFLIDNVLVCTLPYITGLSQTCPATTGAGYSAGTYTLSAAYTGNSYYASSTSPGYPVVVLPDDTTATLTSSLNPSTVGQAVTFTATIASAFATPNGSVTFFDGTSPIGTTTLNGSGIATLTTSALALGSHNITASYAGNNNFNASSTAVLVQVVNALPVSTTLMLASSVNPSTVGQSVTFTAVVTGSTTTVSQPSGTISFVIDGGSAVTAPLTNGTASFSTSTLTQGSHTVLATFAGGTTSAGDTFTGSSAVLIQVVTVAPPAPSYTLTVTPAAISVPIGNSVSVLVTITAMNGYNQIVALGCGDLPHGVTCSFDTSTISGGSGVAHLLVHATAPHDCSNNDEYFHAAGPATWLGAALLGGLIVLLRRRSKPLQGIALAFLLAALCFVAGCGNCTDLGTKPGNYSFAVQAGTVRLSANSGTTVLDVQHSQTIQMVARL